MKNILTSTRNAKKINNQKSFTILEAFRDKFPLNYIAKVKEININRNKDLTEKIKQIQNIRRFNLNDIVKDYQVIEERNDKMSRLLDSAKNEIEEEVDLSSPIMLSKKIEKIVAAPHLTFREVNQHNQETFYDILTNCSITKDLIETQTSIINQPSSGWKINKIIVLIKYIHISLANFPIFIQDSKIHDIIKNSIFEHKIFFTKSGSMATDLIISINFAYEIMKLRDLFEYSDQVKNMDSIFNVLNLMSFTEESIKKHIEHILKINNIYSRLDGLNKFLFTLAKIKKDSNNFLNKEIRGKLNEFLASINIHKEEYFMNDVPKTILFYLSLDKLGLLNKELITKIKYNNMLFDDFHILFKTVLSKPEHIPEIDADNVNLQMNLIENRKEFLDNFSMRKMILMRGTFDWLAKSSLFFITFYNQMGGIQFNARRFFASVLTRTVDLVPTLSSAEEIVFASYLISAYIADVTNYFEAIGEKNFDIQDVNPALLNKFVDSVVFRMKYSIRYDHEIYILNKIKKDFYLPYSPQMDKFIVYITKQFLYKIDSDVVMSPELFLAGLKCLKIIFTNDVLDFNYIINDSIIQSMKPFVNKCLKRGSKYLKYITTKDIDIIDTLTQIMPHIKFHFDNSQTDKTINNTNSSELFNSFLLNLLKQEFTKIEDKLRVVINVSEHMIIEMNKSNFTELPIHFSEINSYIFKHIDGVLSRIVTSDNDAKLNLKKVTDSDFFEAKIPVLMINLYNVFSYEKEKYSSIISLITSYIKEKKGLRNLKGYELLKVRKDIMNENTLFQILSNLQTIQFSKNKVKENLITKILNEATLKNFVNDIINSLGNFNNNCQIFSQFNFSSFSYMASTIFEHFSTEEVTKILKILGNKRIENYHPQFIKNLVTRYSDRELLFSLVKKKENEFFNLTLSWPLFIKNEELVRTILHCHLSKLLQFSRYEIINVLTFNHINHIKLFSFFGSSIQKIKNISLKKKIFCDYIHNCTYIGFKMELGLYEEMLKIFNDILTSSPQITFSLAELNDLISLSIISNILDMSLSKENQKVYFSILSNINREMVNKLVLKVDENEISYYPSIPSEDRFFQKSLSNVTTREGIFDIKDENEEEKPEEDKQSLYMRKSSEGHLAIDLEFENYFTKKRELMYGHQAYLNDNMVIRQIIKKWFIAKLFGINLEDEYLENQLEQIFSHLKKTIKSKSNYEKFYLKMLSFGFQFNFTIEPEYKEPVTGFRIDYMIEHNGKKNFILIVPEEFTSVNIDENKKHPDGIFCLFIECIKRLLDVNLIPVLESDLINMSDADYNFHIIDKILNK